MAINQSDTMSRAREQALLYCTGVAYQRYCADPNDATARRFMGLVNRDEAIFKAALMDELADATDQTIIVRLTEALRHCE